MRTVLFLPQLMCPLDGSIQCEPSQLSNLLFVESSPVVEELSDILSMRVCVNWSLEVWDSLIF